MLASVTCTSNREHMIADAIKSVVDWVDYVILLDLGITDNTEKIAREIAGDKVRIRKAVGTTMGEWRNEGIDFATELGCKWAVMLDTDERILIPPGMNVKETIWDVPGDFIITFDVGGTYKKERFFKLPMKQRYEKNCHEKIVGQKEYAILEHVFFYELQKAPEVQYERCGWIISQMLKELEENPKDSRSWRQLADAYSSREEIPQAYEAYKNAAFTSDWSEEKAWTHFRAACEAYRMSKFDMALEHCGLGIIADPTYCENPWMAAAITLQRDEPLRAIAFARMAVPNGKFCGIGNTVARVHFSLQEAYYDAPFFIIEEAARKIGDAQGADEALQTALKAQEMRLRLFPPVENLLAATGQVPQVQGSPQPLPESEP